MRRLLAFGLALLSICACSPRQPSAPDTAPPPPPPPPPSASKQQPAEPPALAGTAWVVERIEGQEELKNRRSTLEFLEEARAAGGGGCNRYGGPVQIQGATVRFGELLSTKMACDAPLMEQEQKFFSALAAVRGYRMEEGRLVLLDEAGEPRLRLAPNNDPSS